MNSQRFISLKSEANEEYLLRFDSIVAAVKLQNQLFWNCRFVFGGMGIELKNIKEPTFTEMKNLLTQSNVAQIKFDL